MLIEHPKKKNRVNGIKFSCPHIGGKYSLWPRLHVEWWLQHWPYRPLVSLFFTCILLQQWLFRLHALLGLTTFEFSYMGFLKTIIFFLLLMFFILIHSKLVKTFPFSIFIIIAFIGNFLIWEVQLLQMDSLVTITSSDFGWGEGDAIVLLGLQTSPIFLVAKVACS